MQEFDPISDGELNELLKENLLASDKADHLVDMQAEVVFAGNATVTPPLLKEQELFSKLGVKAASKFSTGWVFTSLSVVAVIVVTSVAFVMNSGAEEKKHNKISSQELVITAASAKTPEISQAAIVAENAPPKTEDNKEKTQVAEVKTEVATSEQTDVRPTNTVAVVSPVANSTVVPSLNISANSIPETKTATPSISNNRVEEKTSTNPVPPVTPAKSGKMKVSSCRIWNTDDICAPPDSLKFPYKIECDACAYEYECKEIRNKKLTPVILRIYKKTGFTLGKGFHSITLTRADGVKLEPFAISIDRYMNGVKKLGVNFKNVVDMIILFPEASPGDRVTIEGVVDVVIEK